MVFDHNWGGVSPKHTLREVKKKKKKKWMDLVQLTSKPPPPPPPAPPKNGLCFFSPLFYRSFPIFKT